MKKQKLSKKTIVIVLGIIVAAVILTVAGLMVYEYCCATKIPLTKMNYPGKHDFSVCGKIPLAPQGGQPGAETFSVCLIKNDVCIYKHAYQEQITGCDPKFTEANPYGNPECFKWMFNYYDASGKVMANYKDPYESDTPCIPTTEEYFESKIVK